MSTSLLLLNIADLTLCVFFVVAPLILRRQNLSEHRNLYTDLVFLVPTPTHINCTTSGSLRLGALQGKGHNKRGLANFSTTSLYPISPNQLMLNLSHSHGFCASLLPLYFHQHCDDGRSRPWQCDRSSRRRRQRHRAVVECSAHIIIINI